MNTQGHSKTNQQAQPSGTGATTDAAPARTTFPKWDGSNHGPTGLVRRMTKSADARTQAPLYVVDGLDDAAPAAAGFNLLGQPMSVLPLSTAERIQFASTTKHKLSKLLPQELERERDQWTRLPRLGAPGIDIDPRKDDQGERTPAARAFAIELGRRVVAAFAESGIGFRAAWSSGPDGSSGGIHLDWLAPEELAELAEVNLLMAVEAFVSKVCDAASIPTSSTKGEADLAWVDLVPLHHFTNNRGRLWRPLGGLHKDGVNRKALIGWDVQGGPLTREHLAVELVELSEVVADRAHAKRKARKRGNPLDKVEPIIPRRQSELGELRAFLARHRPASGDVRQSHRMAWAATLLLDGIRERDVRWCLAKAIGNQRASSRIVERSKRLITSGEPYLRRTNLETWLGTKVLAEYGSILAAIKTKDAEKAEGAKAKDAAGGLRALVRSVSGLSKTVKRSLVAHSELLRERDATDSAIGGLLRPSICRTIHEWVTCSLCKGERGRRRIACEDEMCAWCHGTRVLHEHDLAAKEWTAAGVLEVVALKVTGFKTLAASDEWVRVQAFGRQGVKLLKVRTLTYREPTDQEKADAKAAGGFEPTGRIEHGIILAASYKSWTQAVLRGSERRAQGRADHAATGLVAKEARYTTAGAAELIARGRWATHMALRTAATLGEVEELARTLRMMFRRRAASSGKGALSWPGRIAARESIAEEVAAKREETAAAEATALEERGESAPAHGEPGHQCEGCPTAIAAPEHHLMSSGRPDAEVVHTQRFPHTLERGWRLLAARNVQAKQVAEATATARATSARAKQKRVEELARVPF